MVRRRSKRISSDDMVVMRRSRRRSTRRSRKTRRSRNMRRSRKTRRSRNMRRSRKVRRTRRTRRTRRMKGGSGEAVDDKQRLTNKVKTAFDKLYKIRMEYDEKGIPFDDFKDNSDFKQATAEYRHAKKAKKNYESAESGGSMGAKFHAHRAVGPLFEVP